MTSGNRRKARCGAFWEDRYHATAVALLMYGLLCRGQIKLRRIGGWKD